MQREPDKKIPVQYMKKKEETQVARPPNCLDSLDLTELLSKNSNTKKLAPTAFKRPFYIKQFTF